MELPWDGTTWKGFYPVYVAVLDSGVYRQHVDFEYEIFGGIKKKSITKTGVDCYGYDWPITSVGSESGRGEPKKLENTHYATHGTKVAATITSATNNSKWATACAPRVGVVPFWLQEDRVNKTYANQSAVMQAYKTLNVWFQKYPFRERVLVVNVSLSREKEYWPEKQLIGLDVPFESDSRRLYVASAGNYGQDALRYPAAYASNQPGDLVLGVSGLWVRIDALEYKTFHLSSGSNYYSRDGRYYPVSGIFGIYRLNGSEVEVHLPSFPPERTDYFGQTSFSTQQVSALAAVLYGRKGYWNVTYREIMNRIISTRRPDQGTHRGLTEYYRALNGW